MVNATNAPATATPTAACYRPRWGKVTALAAVTDQTTPSGILLSENVEDTERLRVVQVGHGEYMESGGFIPPPCQPGDLIVVAKHAGIDVRLSFDTLLRIVGHQDVLAVIEGA